MNVPFLDLKAQYNIIADEISVALLRVIERTAFSGGPFVHLFEREFAAFCHCRHAIGVGSGTEALWLTLMALGVGPGDEVITAPNSFIATAEAISLCGATPVFVDVDEQSQTLDPELLELAISPKTRGVIPVHLYGQMADMAPILAIASEHRLFVVEDACQAHGAIYRGRPAGSMGDAGCFSFYPGKNLGAYGEAGAIVCNSDELADKLRKLRDHGQSEKYYHDLIGCNARMDGMQAAVLEVKLKYLAAWNEARRKRARLYSDLLGDLSEVIAPSEMPYGKHVYHVYSVRARRRDELKERLAARGVICGIHYPVPLHLQEAYAFLQLGPGSYPVCEKLADELLSLPMFPELTEKQVEYVVSEIRRFYLRY